MYAFLIFPLYNYNIIITIKMPSQYSIQISNIVSSHSNTLVMYMSENKFLHYKLGTSPKQ